MRNQYRNSALIVFASNATAPAVRSVLASEGIACLQTQGGYRDFPPETAYVTDAVFFDRIRAAGILDGQESILWLSPVQKDGARKTWLVYATGKSEFLGDFTPYLSLSDGTPYTDLGWTLYDGMYWTAVPTCGPDPMLFDSVADVQAAAYAWAGARPDWQEYSWMA